MKATDLYIFELSSTLSRNCGIISPESLNLLVVNMLKTLWATVRQGKIELLESTELVEGTQVLVTLIPNDEAEFWLQTSQISLNEVWENTEDDVYAQLL